MGVDSAYKPRAGRKEWDLWTGTGMEQMGTLAHYLTMKQALAPGDWGLHWAGGVTVRREKSGLVFAGREVRFGQVLRE